MLRAGALGRPRRMGWGGRREGGSGWGTHVNPWLIHVNVWQKPLQYCKVISLQQIKRKNKKRKNITELAEEEETWSTDVMVFAPSTQGGRGRASPEVQASALDPTLDQSAHHCQWVHVEMLTGVKVLRDQGAGETALADKTHLRQRCRRGCPDHLLRSPQLGRLFSGLGKS